MLTMEKNSILNTVFKFMAERENSWLIRKLFFQFFNIPKQMGIAFLFGKSLNGLIVAGIKIRDKDAFIGRAKMFFDYLARSVRVNVIKGKLLNW